MRRKFSLPVGVISVNSTYYANKRHGMRPEAQEWQHRMFHYLSSKENLAALSELREYFDPKQHSLRFHITVVVPETEYYTKSGEMSSKIVDCTNYEKSIIDVFCLPRYAEKPSPYGLQNLQIDDRYVKRVFSQKVPGESRRIEITVSVGPK